MPLKDKYAPLGDYLRPLAAEHSDVTLTLAEIERIIGRRLPQGARKNVPFWHAPHGKPPPRARAWIGAGFVAQPDLQRERVRFHRVVVPPRPAPAPARHGVPTAGRHGERR